MITDATRLAWVGTTAPLPELRVLTAGPLTAELEGGNLRAIRYRGTEVLRAVSYLVRDKDWGTLALTADEVTVEETADRFQVRFTAAGTNPQGASIRVEVSITGTPERLDFEATATPQGDFDTNRCGFCVLHPIRGVAGRPVSVEHVDGSRTESTMPDLIDPWQPFKDMRTITHEVWPGLKATCRMEGEDAFEMEDQRNWSDASYKTYVRPLTLPWPYRLPDGVAKTQAIRLTLAGDLDRGPQSDAEVGTSIEVGIGGPIGPMPGLGLCVEPGEIAVLLAAPDLLRTLAPTSLLLSFDPTAGDGVDALRGFAAVVGLLACETVLECVVPGVEAPAAELVQIAKLVQEAGLRLDAIAVSPAVDRRSTPPGSPWPACPPLADIYAAARQAFPGLRVGGGMFSFFTELNRKRPPVEALDFVTHAINPIVHAADERSIMETLEALPAITRSTRAIIGAATPYRIGPVTIGMRFNPYGSRTQPNPKGGRVAMARQDPRQDALFAASWLLGVAAQTTDARLETMTVGTMTGDLGLVADLEARRIRPVYQAARGLAALAGQMRLDVSATGQDRVMGVAAREAGGRTTLWLANLTPEEQVAHVASDSGTPWQISTLDHDTLQFATHGDMPAGAATDGDVRLQPYAIARLTRG